jgi:hypothetical protein
LQRFCAQLIQQKPEPFRHFLFRDIVVDALQVRVDLILDSGSGRFVRHIGVHHFSRIFPIIGNQTHLPSVWFPQKFAKGENHDDSAANRVIGCEGGADAPEAGSGQPCPICAAMPVP